MKKIEHEYTQEIVCPYCGCELGDSWEQNDDGNIDCDNCGEEYHYERIIDITYITTKIEKDE